MLVQRTCVSWRLASTLYASGLEGWGFYGPIVPKNGEAKTHCTLQEDSHRSKSKCNDMNHRRFDAGHPLRSKSSEEQRSSR
eukprot:3562410-Amphidinium_carterae.1